MRTFAILLVAALLLLALAADSAIGERRLRRQRRRIDQLGEMITATTGQHYAAYIGYGNYCGPGGAGTPVDELDACCMVHDHCYDRLGELTKQGKCGKQPGPIFNRYLSKFDFSDSGNGNLQCSDDKDAGDYSNCLHQLCECDRQFAQCLVPHKDNYDRTQLKDSQKYLRYLVLLVETSPNVSEAILRLIESLLS